MTAPLPFVVEEGKDGTVNFREAGYPTLGHAIEATRLDYRHDPDHKDVLIDMAAKEIKRFAAQTPAVVQQGKTRREIVAFWTGWAISTATWGAMFLTMRGPL